MKELKDYEDEIWREIPNTQCFYLVSNYGRIKVIPRLIDHKKQGSFWSKEKIISTTLVGKGYLSFCANFNSVHKRFLVHRLVANFWCANPENKKQVNHKDGNKQNNHYLNLEWATPKENINHAFDTGLNKKVQKNDATRSKAVIQLNDNMEVFKEYPSLIEVYRTTGFAHPNIHHSIKNKIKSHGYYWQYKN